MFLTWVRWCNFLRCFCGRTPSTQHSQQFGERSNPGKMNHACPWLGRLLSFFFRKKLCTTTYILWSGYNHREVGPDGRAQQSASSDSRQWKNISFLGQVYAGLCDELCTPEQAWDACKCSSRSPQNLKITGKEPSFSIQTASFQIWQFLTRTLWSHLWLNQVFVLTGNILDIMFYRIFTQTLRNGILWIKIEIFN